MDNRKQVIANDNSIKEQVKGITTEKEKEMKANWLKDQELYYRATDYIGS